MPNEKKKPKVIAVTFQKGGYGKTAVSVNLASILAWKKYNVLLIDGDRHCTASHFLNVHNENEYGFYDVITGRCSFDDAIQVVSYAKSTNCPSRNSYASFKFWAIPAYDNLGKTEEDIKDTKGWQFALKQAIENSSSAESFDYIIIDCPPESDIFLSMIYNAAEYYILPVFAESVTIDNLSISYEQLYTLSDPLSPKKILGCVISNFKKTSRAERIANHLKSLDYINCFNTVLPRYDDYDYLLIFHQPINVYRKEQDSARRLYKAFLAFSDEVIEATNK